MTCWRCQGRGEYLVSRSFADGRRKVEKDCDCGAEKVCFPYGEEAGRGKIAERFRSVPATESPLTTIAVGGDVAESKSTKSNNPEVRAWL